MSGGSGRVGREAAAGGSQVTARADCVTEGLRWALALLAYIPLLITLIWRKKNSDDFSILGSVNVLDCLKLTEG